VEIEAELFYDGEMVSGRFQNRSDPAAYYEEFVRREHGVFLLEAVDVTGADIDELTRWSAAFDPGEQGSDELAEGSGAPSWWHRCLNMSPFDALAAELRGAALSHGTMTGRLRTSLNDWQRGAWLGLADAAAVAPPDPRALARISDHAFRVDDSLRRVRQTAVSVPRLFVIDREAIQRPPMSMEEEIRVRELAEETVDIAARESETLRVDLMRSVQDAMGVAMMASLRGLFEASERQQAATARFERRVAILAGVLTGPAVVAGLAGANVDFWPLPRHNGVLAAGALPVMVLLCVLVGAAAWRYLRPDGAPDRR